MDFTSTEIQEIESHGLTISEVEKQFSILKKGLMFVSLAEVASLDRGIIELKELEFYHKILEKYRNKYSIVKFVPASGAASRMFKSLLESLINQNLVSLHDFQNSLESYAKDTLDFYFNLEKFAFYEDLKHIMKQNNQDCQRAKQEGLVRPFLVYLLTIKGLNYANLPKAFLKFHKRDGKTFSPFQEHLLEEYNEGEALNGITNFHFTLSLKDLNSPELKKQLSILPKDFNFKIDYSVQKTKTDTIALTDKNTLFKTDNDKFLFRPGGHGSLIHNLNDLKSDLVVVRNIDNISNQKRYKQLAMSYQQAMIGYILKLREDIFSILRDLDKGLIPNDIANTLKRLNISQKEIDILQNNPQKLYNKLNRPIRVCGMVKNQGEPGGGPFWVEKEGFLTLQIVEKAQINLNQAKQKKLLEKATHFNPVNLILSITNYKKEKFDLCKYIDEDTSFITVKSYQGHSLKALEWPGLWNGAMADWLTIFIEVPLETFTPVKTVFDLCNFEHQEN